MEAIILIDRNRIIHDVYAIESLSDVDASCIDECARQYGLSTIRRTINKAASAADIRRMIASIDDSTGEIPIVEAPAESAEVPIACSHESPVVNITEPVVEINADGELSFDDDDFERAWGASNAS